MNKLVMHILGMDPKNEGAHLLNATLISAMISDDNASHLLEVRINTDSTWYHACALKCPHAEGLG